ncbi:LytTR family DNA-binding domain-containing protein [Variovorax sp. YR216]|uniref:LytR/AlgR family response regulator transcription factor n=1 Tax=Variovorax sp. YR216 TaxID=1882828 RepID=UPI0008955A34|nr:LytTR family DNA-binding domain-containing protein [Variovorax sp. YR216]SEB08548.1 two component transcriptional regulator, LytTR family [Variovorax sp. YR216]
MTTALIAEDEPVLAAEIREELQHLWPGLVICATVHDGNEALREIERHRPQVLFLDVKMPGLTGIEVARAMGTRAHVVFITAFDQYAVQAFEEGAVDYLLKPLDPARLARALRRVQERLAMPPADMSGLLDQLQRRATSDRLRWITVLRGADIHLITVEDVCYFRADNKYIAVVTADSESLITTPLKELAERLDPGMFWQIHRGVIVNINAIKSVRRALGGHLELRLKQRPETLRVSAAYAHLFKHM